jgi:hypothetical protein
MTEKIKPKTKAELLEMLAEAVRNTQPQQRKTQSRNTRPIPKRTAKIKSVRASASRKKQRRR